MIKAIKIKKGYEIALILIFLAAMNFQAKFFYFLFFSFFIVIVERKCVIDAAAVITLILCMIMGFYNTSEGIMSVLRCLGPFCAYLIGLNLTSYNLPASLNAQESITQKRIFQILASIALGAFSHYLLNFFYNLGSSIGRNTNDIWTGVPMAATGQSALICIVMGLSCAMLFIPYRKWCRYAAIFNILMILIYNLVLSCRTPVVMLAILILLCFFYPRKRIKYGTQLLKYSKWIFAAAILAIAIYTLNVFGIRSFIQKSEFVMRFGGLVGFLTGGESRSITKSNYISQMINYPMGGCHIRARYGFAHDLLLDGYDEYGVLVFVLLIVILIIGIKQLYLLMRGTSCSESIKLAIFGVYVAILLEFYVEPILTGMPWLFSCFFLINGCIASMNRKHLQNCNEGALKQRNENFTNKHRVSQGQHRLNSKSNS